MGSFFVLDKSSHKIFSSALLFTSILSAVSWKRSLRYTDQFKIHVLLLIVWALSHSDYYSPDSAISILDMLS